MAGNMPLANTSSAPEAASPAIIEIRHLSKRYGRNGEAALRDVNLRIAPAEIFGLLGPNGAGKTTTISILCGLIKPSGGEVFVDGFSLQKDLLKIKQIIGVVPQDIALYHSLTARQNLLYFGRMYGLSGSELQERVEESLRLLGLEHRADEPVRHFSGGMKRRVNMIAGVLHKPKILILDEPTVGVDVHSRRVILDYLVTLQQEGTTIIYTSHYLEEAQNLCTRVAIIDKGSIIAEGTPGTLMSNGDARPDLEKLFIELTGSDWNN